MTRAACAGSTPPSIPGAADFEQFLEQGEKNGIDEVIVVPWVPDRDPFEVLAEIAKIGGTALTERETRLRW